eukprot:51441_1
MTNQDVIIKLQKQLALKTQIINQKVAIEEEQKMKIKTLSDDLNLLKDEYNGTKTIVHSLQTKNSTLQKQLKATNKSIEAKSVEIEELINQRDKFKQMYDDLSGRYYHPQQIIEIEVDEKNNPDFYHTGKYHTVNKGNAFWKESFKQWSCCQRSDKLAQGCNKRYLKKILLQYPCCKKTKDKEKDSEEKGFDVEFHRGCTKDKIQLLRDERESLRRQINQNSYETLLRTSSLQYLIQKKRKTNDEFVPYSDLIDLIKREGVQNKYNDKQIQLLSVVTYDTYQPDCEFNGNGMNVYASLDETKRVSSDVMINVKFEELNSIKREKLFYEYISSFLDSNNTTVDTMIIQCGLMLNDMNRQEVLTNCLHAQYLIEKAKTRSVKPNNL